MSYSIEYSPEKKRIYPISSSRKPKWILVMLAVMIALFALQKTGKDKIIMSWLLPGDPEITATAFASMVDDIREGESVRDAVTAFCLEIINNA